MAMSGFIKNLASKLSRSLTSKSTPGSPTEPSSDKETVDTFVEATDGGWGDPAEAIPVDGGSQRNYVEDQLESARRQALNEGLEPGDTLKYKLTRIPKGITSPHEIAFGIMMQASRYGFTPGVMHDETIELLIERDLRHDLQNLAPYLRGYFICCI